MATLNLSLPDAMREFVDREVARGLYPTASSYVQELIRRDQRRSEARQAVLRGFESELVGEWSEVRDQLKERLNRR